MLSRYEKTLATYDDPGTIYSYAYGVLSEAYHQFHMGNYNLDQYVTKVQALISAVEFRTAEIVAEQMLDRGMATLLGLEKPQLVAAEPPSAIYAAPDDADGIARDQ